VITLPGVGDGMLPSCLGFDAMADVDRRFRALFEADVDWERGGAFSRVLGGESGLSGFGVALPLPCVVGDLADLGDSCESF
jgi:hypothetical protein